MTEHNDSEIQELLHTWTRNLAPELTEFIDGLDTLAPDLKTLITNHDPELPHQLMADIARWSSAAPEEQVNPLLTRFEEAWGDGQNAVADLIAVSFVENVYDQPCVTRLLGPKLGHYYRAYTGQEPIDAAEIRPIPNVVKQIARLLGRR